MTSIHSCFYHFLEREKPYEVIVVAINGAPEDGIPTEILFFTEEGGKSVNKYLIQPINNVFLNELFILFYTS